MMEIMQSLRLNLYKEAEASFFYRYLSMSWMSGAIPVIVLTKFDLYDPTSRKLDLVYSVSLGAEVIMASEFVAYFLKNKN
jgi:ribosome biogenesis GTPase / thiamine phosphate phosphatase